jgi:hypothetical protein
MQNHKERICMYSAVGGRSVEIVGSNPAEDICFEQVLWM